MVVFNVCKWFVSTTMITMAMAMIMIDSMRVAADGEKLDGKIDLVIIPSLLGSDSERASQKESISTLPNFVEMGNEKVRVAIVSQGSNNDTATIEFPLSGDQSEFQTWVDGWKQESGWWRQKVYYALVLCLEQVFDFNDNDRAKIIIIHMGYRAWNPEPTMNVAAHLRKLGVRIYVIYNGEDEVKNQVPLWTTPARLFLVGQTRTEVAQRSKENMPNVTSAIVRDLCGFCRFDEQGSCNGKLYEGADSDYFGDDRVKCQAINPADISCLMQSGSREECDFECNRRWPWEKRKDVPGCANGWCNDVLAPDCTQLECGVMKRIGDGPPTHMENCPKAHDCRKPVCPTTTSTTPSTTTTTTAMTSSSATTSSTASSIATMAESSPSSPTLSSTASIPKKAQGGSTDSPEGLSVGVIAGIAVAVVILLVIIIATVIFVKKRKNAREQKEKLDLKMEKDRRKSAKKSANKSAGFVDETSVMTKSKGAQTSVVADMSMARNTALQSAIGDAKSKKPTGVDGSKMAAKSSQMAEGKKPGSKSSVGDVEKKSMKMESSKVLKKK